MDVPLQEGDIINDAYRVERVIGSGGMAVVVAALDLHSPRRVAVKVLFRRAAGSPEVLKRFEREQQVVLRLRGEHVARLLDSGIYKNAPYMVMEYLQGSNLAETLRVQGPVPIDLAVEFILQACEAVAEAHARDIVHRDLKPGNLFLTRRPDGSPCIKVLDFGIAKVLAPDRAGDESTLTKTTTVMGSPFYMSPEQVISPRSVGTPTDVWSLGVILFELITGKIPFAAKTPEKVCARVLNDPPDSLRALRPECPEGLESAIVKCLQRRPEHRHADVAAFAKAIAPFAPKHARIAPARIARILVKPEAAAPPRDSSHDLVAARDAAEVVEPPTLYIPASRRGGSHKTILLAAFGIAMLALGFAGGFLMRAKPPAQPPAPSIASAPLPPVTSIVLASPSAAETESAAPEPSAALADIPIELDLDEDAARAAAKHRAELRRKREAEAAAASAQTASADVAAPAASAAEPTPADVPVTRSSAPRSSSSRPTPLAPATHANTAPTAPPSSPAAALPTHDAPVTATPAGS